jgi:hypothetical protein
MTAQYQRGGHLGINLCGTPIVKLRRSLDTMPSGQ